MPRALKANESLEGKVTVTLTQRDMLLLKLCLQLVAQNYTGDSALRFGIQRLRDKLSTEQVQECLSRLLGRGKTEEAMKQMLA